MSAFAVTHLHWTCQVHDSVDEKWKSRTTDTDDFLLGSALEVRAVTSLESGDIVLEAQTGNATLSGNKPDDGIDVPDIRSQVLSTRLVVPDGGTALIGGALWPGESLPANRADAPTITLVTARRSSPPAPAPGAREHDTGTIIALQEKLESTIVSVNVEDVPVETVARSVLDKAGVGLIVASNVLEYSHSDRAVTMDVSGIRADRMLALLADATGFNLLSMPDGVVLLVEDGYPRVCHTNVDINDLVFASEYRPFWTDTIDADGGPVLMFPDEEDRSQLDVDDVVDYVTTSMDAYEWDNGFVDSAPGVRLTIAHENPAALKAGRRAVESLRRVVVGQVVLEWEIRDIRNAGLQRAMEACDTVDGELRKQLDGADLRALGAACVPFAQRVSFCDGEWKGRVIAESGSTESEAGSVSKWSERRVAFDHVGLTWSARAVRMPDDGVGLAFRASLGTANEQGAISHSGVVADLTLKSGQTAVAGFMDGPPDTLRVLLVRATRSR